MSTQLLLACNSLPGTASYTCPKFDNALIAKNGSFYPDHSITTVAGHASWCSDASDRMIIGRQMAGDGRRSIHVKQRATSMTAAQWVAQHC
jgi:hypothetical protein